MKNKSKKILAGVALGVMGAASLTGCSMSAEQQAALDKVVSKTDEIIELVDKNMTIQNQKLSKEEASEKILLAKNYWYEPTLNARVSYERQSYDGFYGKLTYESELSFSYNHDLDGAKYYMYEKSKSYENDSDYESHEYWKSDVKNDKYYSYSETKGKQNLFSEGSYDVNKFLEYHQQLDVLSFLEIDVITPDMIVDLEAIENGYKFVVYNYTAWGDNIARLKANITIQDDRITDIKFEIVSVRIEDDYNKSEKDSSGNYVDPLDVVFNAVLRHGDYEKVQVEVYDCKYEYDVDFRTIDAKFASIEGQYLTQA